MKTFYLRAPYQTGFKINCDCDNTNKELVLHFGKYLTEENTFAEHEINIVRRGANYTLSADGIAHETSDPLTDMDRYIFNNTKYDDSVFAIHGAAVEYNEKAYLLLAATTGGKTTLATYLSCRGMGYITEDCILLDRENFCIHPFNSPIHLRPGGIEVLKKYGISLQLKQYRNGIYQRFIYNPENFVTCEIPLGKIFFITRTVYENKVENMSTVDKIAQLLKSPITLYDTNTDYIKFISKLSMQECRVLKYSDMDFVREVIING